MTIEYRAVGGSATAAEGVLTGLVTPFNVWTNIGDPKRGGFREQIAPGAFKKTLQEGDVVLLNNHDTGQPMARTSIKDGPGSLSLIEDPNAGLRMTATPVDTSYARDLMLNTAAGVVRGMSFGFETVKDDWMDDAGRPSDSVRGTQRIVREAKLPEVTTTAFPAYATTELAVRDARSTRAAKANYSDLHTCADCGSTGQYGSYCGDCGKAMGDGESSNDYCTSCGSKMSGKRSEHVCETRDVRSALRAAGFGDELLDLAAGLLTAYNALPRSLRDDVDQDLPGTEVLRVLSLGALCDLLGVDPATLPPAVAEAVAAISTYKQSLAEQVSADGGHGEVSEGSRSTSDGAGEDHSEDIETQRLLARTRAAVFGIALDV